MFNSKYKFCEFRIKKIFGNKTKKSDFSICKKSLLKRYYFVMTIIIFKLGLYRSYFNKFRGTKKCQYQKKSYRINYLFIPLCYFAV